MRTTIVTFLMVFLIQNTQNRDAQAVQIKLNELIRALKDARNEMIDIDDLSEKELARLRKDFREERKREEAQLEEITKELERRRREERRKEKSE